MTGDVDVVLAFDAAINRADLPALAGLMADGHRFVDAAGSVVEGRDACTDAWRSFFESFPDYRNELDTVDALGGGRVRAVGRSRCSFAPLDGPAVWNALVADGRILEWRVDDPA